MNTTSPHTYDASSSDFAALQQLLTKRAGVYDVQHAGSTIAQIIVHPKNSKVQGPKSIKSSRVGALAKSHTDQDLNEGASRGADIYHREKKMRELGELYIV